MDDKRQGSEEVLSDVKDKAKELQQRDLTTTDRLDKFFSNQPKYGEEPKPQPTQAAEEKQPEPMPSSEQTKTEQTEVPQPKIEEQPQPESVSEQEALDNSKNPERTREYIERLQAENRRLKEEQRKQYGGSVFEELRGGQEQPTAPANQYPGVQSVQPPYIPPIQLPHPYPNANQYAGLNQQQVENIAQQFVDPQGNVDINGLNNALSNANRRAMQAEANARQATLIAQQANQNITRYEEDQQVREAHAAVPEIDPLNKDKFDPELFELVRDRIFRNMQTGKRERLVDIATSIRKLKTKEEKAQAQPSADLKKVEEQAVAKYKQTQEQRNQGPMESGRGEDRQNVTLEQLRKATRRGGIDNNALDARLKSAGIIS